MWSATPAAIAGVALRKRSVCVLHAKAHVRSRKVVVHEVEADGVRVELDLLGESISKTRKTPHPHSHGQVLALDV
jgi:hypothetical protein